MLNCTEITGHSPEPCRIPENTCSSLTAGKLVSAKEDVQILFSSTVQSHCFSCLHSFSNFVTHISTGILYYFCWQTCTHIAQFKNSKSTFCVILGCLTLNISSSPTMCVCGVCVCTFKLKGLRNVSNDSNKLCMAVFTKCHTDQGRYDEIVKQLHHKTSIIKNRKSKNNEIKQD